MKTRRVIQKLKVKDGEFIYEGIGYGSMGVEREKFPDGTKAELAVYVDSPPKRELVVPEGISWQRNLMRHEKEGQEYLLSINDGSLIGSVREDEDKYFWRAGYYDMSGWRLTRGEADRAVYETFANLNRHGFSWKTPEPPKERVVLPEGMKWVSHNQVLSLYTAEGAAIAQVIDTAGTVWPPFRVGEFAIYHGKTDDEAMKLVENALAEHGYFGVRKVVDNE